MLRTVAQLAIDYRHSPLSLNSRPRPRHGPRAGDRLPDTTLNANNKPSTLHEALTGPKFHALLVGPHSHWPQNTVDRIAQRAPGIVDIHRLDTRPATGVLHDPDGTARKRLGLTPPDDTAIYLIRPDGHIAYRRAGSDPTGLHAYLDRWFPITGCLH